MVEISSSHLPKLDSIQSLISSSVLVLTNRVILVQDKILAVKSGRVYQALSGLLKLDGYKVLSCKHVPNSDKIVVQMWSDKLSQWRLLCLQNPSSRSNNPFGHIGLQRTKFANFVAKDLLLAKTDQHWSLFKDSSVPVEIPPGLKQILKER